MARSIERRCLEWLFIINEKNTVNAVRMVTSFFLSYLVMKTFNNRTTYSYLLNAHRASRECLSFRTSGTQLRRPLSCLCDIQGLSFFCLSLVARRNYVDASFFSSNMYQAQLGNHLQSRR